MIKTQSLMKMGGVIALLATTLAVSDSATAIGFSNFSFNTTFGNPSGDTIGQSFNFNSGTATYLLEDWTFAVRQFNNGNFDPLSASATLNIYAGTGVGSIGSEIGSVANYNSSVLLDGYLTAAKWTFAGGLSLNSNQTYTAAVITSAGLNFAASNANPYINGIVTRDLSGNLTGTDTVFSATATPVPFDFEPTSGLLVLGGGWLLRRHLKKRAKKV